MLFPSPSPTVCAPGHGNASLQKESRELQKGTADAVKLQSSSDVRMSMFLHNLFKLFVDSAELVEGLLMIVFSFPVTDRVRARAWELLPFKKNRVIFEEAQPMK